MKTKILSSIASLAVTFFLGCGDGKPPLPTADKMADAKLAAITKLVEIFSKDPNSAEAFEYLEAFRQSQYNPSAQPETTAKILEVYKKQIEGKYRSEMANQLGIEVKLFEREAKK